MKHVLTFLLPALLAACASTPSVAPEESGSVHGSPRQVPPEDTGHVHGFPRPAPPEATEPECDPREKGCEDPR